jgi:hypothetical protein
MPIETSSPKPKAPAKPKAEPKAKAPAAPAPAPAPKPPMSRKMGEFKAALARNQGRCNKVEIQRLERAIERLEKSEG